jgi:hypothetical protein
MPNLTVDRAGSVINFNGCNLRPNQPVGSRVESLSHISIHRLIWDVPYLFISSKTHKQIREINYLLDLKISIISASTYFPQDQNSIPGCALIPCSRNGCLMRVISVTRSATSIRLWGAPLPVRITWVRSGFWANPAIATAGSK